MITPTQQQIDRVLLLLRTSIQNLVTNDSDIFNIELIEPPQISEDAKTLNRELHETTINHRLAYYLERNIQSTELAAYKIDIEYNRFYGNAKEVETVDGLVRIRPDIIIHSRMNADIQPQHFLVIEAKKWNISNQDINKLKGLISDNNYNYVFGFALSYCLNETHVVGVLYYFDGNEIVQAILEVAK